jgi:hypothetical protein
VRTGSANSPAAGGCLLDFLDAVVFFVVWGVAAVIIYIVGDAVRAVIRGLRNDWTDGGEP